MKAGTALIAGLVMGAAAALIAKKVAAQEQTTGYVCDMSDVTFYGSTWQSCPPVRNDWC